MSRSIKTYSMSERVTDTDFGIHDERATTRIGQAHRHEYFQIQITLSGQAVSHIGATEHKLVPGSLVFVLPYRVHRVQREPGSRFFVLNFSRRFLRPELDVDALDLEDVPLDHAPEIAPFLFQEFADFRLRGGELASATMACKRMAEENGKRRFCSVELIRAHLLLLIGTVCRKHERELLELAAGKAQRRSRRDALMRVMRHVREHFSGRITIAGAAAAADLSPSYLAHLIKKETGKTFVDLVTERRMEKARELLTHTTLRIGEIAATVGFTDEAYFARRFRQSYRQSPRQFRARAAVR